MCAARPAPYLPSSSVRHEANVRELVDGAADVSGVRAASGPEEPPNPPLDRDDREEEKEDELANEEDELTVAGEEEKLHEWMALETAAKRPAAAGVAAVSDGAEAVADRIDATVPMVRLADGAIRLVVAARIVLVVRVVCRSALLRCCRVKAPRR